MKTTKKVFAIILAAMMIALCIPFAVSATELTASTTDYSLTINCDKAGYTYTVYKIADYDDTQGRFFNGATTAINTAINNSTDSTAAVLTAADAATLSNGTAISFTSSKTSETLTLKGGMYYIKCTAVSINNDKVEQNNIVPLPNKNMTGTTFTVDVATNKIKEGGEPSVYKVIEKADGATTNELSVSQDDTITYVLTADIAGTVDNKLSKYIIGDEMDTANLSVSDVSIVSVQLVNGSTKTDLQYDKIDSGSDLTSTKGYNYTFGVSVKSTELDKDTFYTAGNQVVVKFTTKLTANAQAGVDIINKDGLKYTNKSGAENEVRGQEVKVYTFKVKVTKVDADSTTTKLGGAKFKIYSAYNTSSKELSGLITESAATDATTGAVVFDYKFAEGTYYIQESQAPAGYALNKDVFTVNITKGSNSIESGVHNATVVTDTKVKLPDTGGAGTMIFTIVGASLIVCAGILLVIVLKKRSSSK